VKKGNPKEEVKEKIQNIEKNEFYFSNKYEESKKQAFDTLPKKNQLEPIGSPP